MEILALLIGIWSGPCTQTQIDGRAGYTIESYEISEKGHYAFTRTWYKGQGCEVSVGEDEETGKLTIGRRLSGMFVTGLTYEVDFQSLTGEDLGAIRLSDNVIHVARGQKGSSFRNTMVGVFDFHRN